LLLRKQLQNVLTICIDERYTNWVTMQYASETKPSLVDASKRLITDTNRNPTSH